MRQKTVGFVVSLALFFLFAELLSLGGYSFSGWYFENRVELFYFSQRPKLSIEGGEAGALLTPTRFHPFFTYHLTQVLFSPATLFLGQVL
jgi:hypothetical protein